MKCYIKLKFNFCLCNGFKCWFTLNPFSVCKTNIFQKILLTNKRIIENIFYGPPMRLKSPVRQGARLICDMVKKIFVKI